MKIAVGLSGGSGAIYALALLQYLGELGVERHLVATRMGLKVMEHECGIAEQELRAYCEYYHDNQNLGSVLASGSAPLDGMAVVPCSMKTLAGIAGGYSDSLLTRAADVCIKERRRLVLAVRETPLSPIHLENMLKLARLGVVILPACPGFYHHPRDLSDIVRFMAGKLLDQLGIAHEVYPRWNGEDMAWNDR